MTWQIRPGTDDSLVLDAHEPGLIDILLELTKPGDWFLDVGAHVGKYAVRMALEGRRVVAVEGLPASAAALKVNAESFGVGLEIYRMVAWDRKCRVRRLERAGAGNTSWVEDSNGDETAAPIDTIRGDHPFKLVKMDVEGAERHILDGMTQIVSRHRPRFIIELHEQLIQGITDQVAAFFTQVGYRWKIRYVYGGSEYMEAW